MLAILPPLKNIGLFLDYCLGKYGLNIGLFHGGTNRVFPIDCFVKQNDLTSIDSLLPLRQFGFSQEIFEYIYF